MTSSWADRDRFAQITRNVVARCETLGRCCFASRATFISASDEFSEVGADVLEWWITQEALLEEHWTIESLVVRSPPSVTECQQEQPQRQQHGEHGTDEPHGTQHRSLTGAVLDFSSRLVLSPAVSACTTLWSWGTWAAQGVVTKIPSRLLHVSPSDGIVTCSSSSSTSVDVVPLTWPKFRDGQNNYSSRSESGVIFVPALHKLCMSVIHNVTEMSSRNEYLQLFTASQWEDLLLSHLDIRNGDVVTEFLHWNGLVVLLEDKSTRVRCVYFHSDPKAAVELPPAMRSVLHWKAVQERIDDAVSRWEGAIQMLQDLRTDENDPEMSLLEGKLNRHKLVHIQMTKLNDKLRHGKGTSSSSVFTSDCDEAASLLTVDECCKEWEAMMENFPDALQALSEDL